jgi:hypothetical protein
MMLTAVGAACGWKRQTLGHCVLGATTPVSTALGLAGRQYASWDSDIFDPSDSKAYLRPDTQVLNIKFAPKGWTKGTNTLWEEIASGSQDSQIDAWAVALNKVPRRLAIALHHEPIPGQGPPPDCGQEGCASDLVAAVRRVVTKWKAAGVKHILAQCLIAEVFMHGLQDPRLAIDVLDAVGVDGYGQQNSRKTFLDAPTIFDAPLAYARAQGKPLVIFETAFHDALPGQEKTFYESLDRYLKTNPDIICCCLWLASSQFGNDALNAEGLAVVTRMARDPYYVRTFGA